MADPYAADAEFYDLFNGGERGDVGLWQSYAGRTELPVLEVGTGTGRIAVALALAGHEVMALDPSQAMLARARAKAEDAGVDVAFIEGRATDVILEAERFGLVIVPADVFLYAADGEEQVETLACLGRALAYNGLLAIDLPGPAAWLDAATNGQVQLVYSGETGEGEQLDIWQVHEDDLALQRRWLRLTYDRVGRDGMVHRTLSEHPLRYVYRFEMEYLLRAGGLAPLDVYGDYELGPLTNDSERMIFVSRRRAG
jgi:SAM-dependent methyltransferase